MYNNTAMKNEFNKLKNRLLIEITVKSAICGVAAGLFAVGAVLLGLKLADISINAGFYVLIGLGVAALSGGAAFLLMRFTDKEFAKKLDETHKLNEKIQTMVEFEGQDGEMYELQRRDAHERIAALPERRLDIKKLWQYIVISVLSLALFITAVALPAFKDDPGYDDRPFSYSDRQRAAMKSLIEDVKNSSLSETEITAVTATLSATSDALESVETESLMKATVISAVAFTDTALYTPNSFDNAAYALDTADSGDDKKVEFLSAALKDGVLFYKADAASINSFDRVKTLESGLYNSIGENVDVDMAVFVQQYGIKISDGLKDRITGINELIGAVSDENVAPADDALRQSLEKFAADMAALAADIGSYDDDSAARATDGNINSFKDGLVEALRPQSYRCITDEYVRRRLAQIFGISVDELPSQKSGVTELDEKKDDDDGTNSGGHGKGDEVYGSNELVYDPDAGEYVVYGTYINQYYASVTEQLLSGEMSESLQENIKNYFSILYSGTKNDKEDEKED